MTEFITEITCELRKPVKYTPKGSGEFKDAESIIISAPSNKVMSQLSRLEQGYSRAEEEQSSSMADKLFSSGLMQDKGFMQQMDEAQTKDKEKYKGLSADEIGAKAIDLIKSSSKVDFDEYLSIFRDILLKTARLDDEVNVTDPIYQAIDLS